MREYIAISSLGLLLHWLTELSIAYRKTKKYKVHFNWGLFLEENLINFLVCVTSSIVIFFLVDVEQIKAMTFPYFKFLRMDTIFFLSGGMMRSYIVNQTLKVIEFMFRFNKK